jgi:hypothetical protein
VKKLKEDKPVSENVTMWLAEIDDAKKREDNYRAEGKKVREIYTGERKETTPYNVLFSNTEVMLPSLYSAMPKPEVKRRNKNLAKDDPVGALAARAASRALEYMLDTNVDGDETFNDAMKTATLDCLLAGRGIVTVTYEADVEGNAKRNERVCVEAEGWDKVFHGYARKWRKVPWIAYEKHVDREEATRIYGEEKANAIEYSTGGEKEDKGRARDKDQLGARKMATVYQIWDRDKKRVLHVSRAYTDDYLLEIDDPLNLTGFFNTPDPMMVIEKTHDLMPSSLYLLYENQAIELNSITNRINKIVKAMKARGIYDQALGEDVGRLLDADDNQLVPTDKGGSFAAERGLDNAIWFMPLDKLIVVLRELYTARESCKQTIYEIMGISDILRGSTNANETLGAQEIKTQWGVLRLKTRQQEVQRYVRDLFRMMIDVASAKFSEETWEAMTGLGLMTTRDMIAMQAQAQTIQDPAAQQQFMAQMQQPKWQDVLAVLRDDFSRSYKIDIETNSTVQPEAAEDQKNITEMMTALGQFLNGIAPAVQSGLIPFDTAKGMTLAIVQRYRLGDEIEGMLRAAQAPQQQGDPKQAQQMQDLQKQVAQLTQEKQRSDMEMAAMKADKALSEKKMQLDVREMKLKDEEAMLALRQDVAAEKIHNAAESESMKIASERKQLADAGAKVKGDSDALEQGESQMVAAFGELQQGIAALLDAQQQLMAAMAGQSQQLDAIKAATLAKRKRTAVRGPDGRIVEAIDEVMH